MKRFNFVSWTAFASMVQLTSASADAQTRVACAGEQTTHSLHRENDPEYPLLMAQLLDADFVDSGKMAPMGGGFLEGGGTNFTVGSFAHPQASVLNHDLENPKTFLKSAEFQLLIAFKPNIVVLGPFGYHETAAPLANFPADMKALLDAVLAIDSKPTVALATPLPKSGVDKADAFTEIDKYTRAAATERQLPLVDVWQEFTGKAALYQDDFHLKVDGRAHLALFVGEAVKTLAQKLEDPGPAQGGSAGTNAGGSSGSAGAPVAGDSGVGGSAGAQSPSAGAGTLPSGGVGGASLPAAGASGTSPVSPVAAAPSSPNASSCGIEAHSSTGYGARGAGLLIAAMLLWRRRR